MKRYHDGGAIPTVTAALTEYMNADELKMLARLIGTSAPARKADLVQHIAQYLRGDELRSAWDALDDLQRAAVAEVVHSRGTAFDSGRFKAKYGRAPVWGAFDRYGRNRTRRDAR